MSARSAKLFIVTLVLCLPWLQQCETTGTGSPYANRIEVPETYTFESRFTDSTSSVQYDLPVVGNLLIQDLTRHIRRLGQSDYAGGSVSEQALLQRYDYQDSYNLSTLSDSNFSALETHYSQIATGASLAHTISDDPIIGAGAFDDQTADQLIRSWIATIAQQSQDAAKTGSPTVYTTDNNLDLSELIRQVALGAVVYHQATSKYLSIVLDQENREAANSGASPYTNREHYWDRAFGYFGAARHYASFSDSSLAELSGSPYSDADSDNQIAFTSEYNFTFARLAGIRDATAEEVDFTGTLFQNFLEGRTNISNQASDIQIEQNINEIARTWDRVVAASIIHNINELQREILADPLPRYQFNRHWSAMRGLTIVLQYNPFRRISNNEIRELANLMGDQPPSSSSFNSYSDNLTTAKVKLKTIYEFSNTNVDRW
jgi:hypothetical protein